MKNSVFVISFLIFNCSFFIRSGEAASSKSNGSKDQNIEDHVKRVIQQKAKNRGITLTDAQINAIYNRVTLSHL